MGSAVAQIEIQAKSAGLAAQLREVRSQFGAAADGIAQVFIDKAAKAKKGGLFGKKGLFGMNHAGDALGVAGGNMLSGAVGRGESFIEDIAKQTFDFEKNLVRFRVAARQTPAQIDSLRASINGLTVETGLSKEELLGAARSYVDLAGAGKYSADTLRTIARAAQASGSDVKDVATTVYSLGDAMKIDPKDMEGTLSGLINQSKDGAVHFNQLAEEIVGIAPKFARFGVTGREGTNQFGALFQVMRSGFKGSAETATGLEGMLKGITLHADRFAEAGVHVYNVGKDGAKHLKPVLEILTAITKSSLAKDPTALIHAFGRGEGEQGFQMWAKHLDLFEQLIEAGKNNTTIQEDLGVVMTSAAGRADVAILKLKQSIAETFTPERIAGFASALESAVKEASDALHFFQGFTHEEQTKGDVANLIDVQQGTADTEWLGGSGEAQAIAYANYIKNLKGGPEGSTESRIKAGKEIEYGVTGEAADTYLKSVSNSRGRVAQGTDPGAIAFQQGFYSSAPQRAFGQSDRDVARAIGKGFDSLVGSIKIVIDGREVTTAVKNTTNHRTEPKK